MPLSTIISRCMKGWHVISPIPITARGSILDKHPERPLRTTFLDSSTTLNETVMNLSPETFERPESGRPSAQLSPEPSLLEVPPNSPRDSLDDGESFTPKGHTLAVDGLKERLATIAPQPERSSEHSTHQQQSLTLGLRNTLQGLTSRLLSYLRPDDYCDTSDRSLEDPTSFQMAPDTSLVCGLPRHPYHDGNSHMQDAFSQAPMDCLAQHLGTLSIQASQGSFELGQVRITKLLLGEIEERHRQPVGYLLANYDRPLGSQNDPDIDYETDTDIDTTTKAHTNTEALAETDINRDTSGGYVSDNIDGGEANTDGYPEDDTDGEGDLHLPLHEYIHLHRPKHEREELMQAIFVHQFVTKGRIDPRSDLEGLIELDLQGYTQKLVERIAKQLALNTAGLSTTAIPDKAMDQYKTWHGPLGRIEEPVMLQKDLGEVKTALRDCEKHHRGILSWFYLLRLQAHLGVLPDLHSFPSSSRGIGKALTGDLQCVTVRATVDRLDLGWDLYRACGLYHRALINANRRFGYKIDAKTQYVYLNLLAQRPNLRMRWVVDETERLLPGSHAPSNLGDIDRMARCQEALKLRPFTELQRRYPDVQVKFKHEWAINILQHEAHFQTDFAAWGQNREVYFHYCTLVLASYGFEPPRDLDIALDKLLALILQEMDRRGAVYLCLMRLCKAKCWLRENGPSLCYQDAIIQQLD